MTIDFSTKSHSRGISARTRSWLIGLEGMKRSLESNVGASLNFAKSPTSRALTPSAAFACPNTSGPSRRTASVTVEGVPSTVRFTVTTILYQVSGGCIA